MRDDPRRLVAGNYPWSVTLETRFADMDVNRHLNNVAISRFFEEARIRFNWNMMTAAELAMRPRYLVAHVAVDYLGEGSYPEPALLTYAMGAVGRTSFRCLMGMFQAGACIALCDTVLVHRGVEGPAALPAELRGRLEGFALMG